MSCRAIHAKEDGVSLGNDHTTGMTVTTATNNIVTFLLVVLNFKISVRRVIYMYMFGYMGSTTFFSQIDCLAFIIPEKEKNDSRIFLLLILAV